MGKLKNYYHILGVARDAEGDTIKRAYRKLALKYHPDHNPGNLQAEEKFKLISEAYAVLIDNQKRSQYNAAWKNAQSGASTAQAAASPQNGPREEGANSSFTYSQEDIFRDMFASAFARQAFRDLAAEFRRSGFRFDENFLGRVFFGGKGFLFGGVFFSGPDAERIRPDHGPDYKTTFSSRATMGHQDETEEEEEDDEPEPERLFTRLGRGAKKLVHTLFGHTAALPDLTSKDIFFNLNLSLHQAQKGTEVKVAYSRNGKNQQVAVKVPPGTRDGARLRLRNMGHVHDNGRSGDLFLTVKVL